MRKGTPFPRQQSMPVDSDDGGPASVNSEEAQWSWSELSDSESPANNPSHDDNSLLGEKIKKYFKGYGWFEGEVTHYDR